MNYGIRYDLFQLANPKVKNPDPGLAAANLDTSLIPIDKNNIGGASASPTASRATAAHSARRRRQLLRPDSEHSDRHRVHPERHSSADVHPDSQPAGVSGYPYRAAGIESHSRYLRVCQGLRAAAHLAMESERRAPPGTRLLPDRRLPRRARRASEPHPRYQFPAGDTAAG